MGRKAPFFKSKMNKTIFSILLLFSFFGSAEIVDTGHARISLIKDHSDFVPGTSINIGLKVSMDEGCRRRRRRRTRERAREPSSNLLHRACTFSSSSRVGVGVCGTPKRSKRV